MVSLWGRTDVVAEVIRATHEAFLANLWPCGTRVKFVGNLQVPQQCQSLTVFKATVLEKQPQLAFLADSMDDVLCHHRCRDDLWNLVELCSGMGIGTMGFGQAGMKTVVAADWCRPFPHCHR
jgi:hypothetical protein